MEVTKQPKIPIFEVHFHDMQLELLPYHYYNTLGFEAELIDYINLVDDSTVLEKIKPLYKDGGRPPVDPRTYFRMHYLYFTRPEITSFRQLCKQLVDPKNHAWRNFIGTPDIKDVPAHSSLSHFRKAVTPELFYEILFDLIRQALKLDGFLQTTLAGMVRIHYNMTAYEAFNSSLSLYPIRTAFALICVFPSVNMIGPIYSFQ